MTRSVGPHHSEVQAAMTLRNGRKVVCKVAPRSCWYFRLTCGVTMPILLSRHRRWPRSRGQSLAEFAIVFPVLMLVIGGIIQFGIIFWGLNTLNQVVRDTGRWAATQVDCTNPAPIVATANEIAAQSSLIGYAAPNGITSAEVTVTWRSEPLSGPCPPTDNQDEAWVTVTIQHDVPVFFPFVPGNGHITSSAEFRMEPEPD
jgi:Flp pilus assembly protein TadG